MNHRDKYSWTKTNVTSCKKINCDNVATVYGSMQRNSSHKCDTIAPVEYSNVLCVKPVSNSQRFVLIDNGGCHRCVTLVDSRRLVNDIIDAVPNMQYILLRVLRESRRDIDSIKIYDFRHKTKRYR